ncbi:hypothetical protein BM536_008420 [Streptomyces phaeoluteigriseus]|uniref:Uncharacterized protein n=1 Tax=Streptomyces phaeoluteigriseus TaxID=114686 RepID=A0A1V6MVC1_9ACTN|nr:hypothetical protein BM536_008420 [Streptomyces phaeoluteigriseus]
MVLANAGAAEGGPLAESDPAVWRRVRSEPGGASGLASGRARCGSPVRSSRIHVCDHAVVPPALRHPAAAAVRAGPKPEVP